MKEIEDRLRELGDRIERRNPDRSLPGSTRSRIKRHRRASAFAGAIAVSTLVLGVPSLMARDVATMPPAGNESVAEEGPVTPATPEPQPHASAIPLARDDFFGAVWPEDDRAETEHGCSEAASDPDGFRTTAVGTALELGRVVLGWDDAEAIVRAEYRNSRQVVLSRGAKAATGASPPSAVDLSMVEYVRGCWSVQSVSPTDTTVPAITMPVRWDRHVEGEGSSQANVISIAFDPPEAAIGRIELTYGDQVESRRFTAAEVSMDQPVAFSLGAIGAYEGGHALILFEDSDGRVTTAIGVPLNPQKGGARADGLP